MDPQQRGMLECVYGALENGPRPLTLSLPIKLTCYQPEYPLKSQLDHRPVYMSDVSHLTIGQLWRKI